MNSDVAKIFSKLILSEKKMRLKLLGDSITHGVGGSGWEQSGESIIEDFKRSPDSYCWANLLRDYLGEQYDCEVVNNGCRGTGIQFIIENLDTLVDEEDDIIVCTIGTNNRHQSFVDGPRRAKEEHARMFYNNIKLLNDKLKATGKDYVIAANIPAGAANEHSGIDLWRIMHMNDVHDLYMKAHFELGFAFIDMYTLFLTYCDNKNIDFETLLSDGLHPNDEGYRVIFKLLLREFGLAEKKHGEI